MPTKRVNVDPVRYFTNARLVIVAGKGGVGKTTVAATLANAAARCGLSALVIDLEGSSGLPRAFGLDRIGYDECVLRDADPQAGHGEIRARRITPDDALVEYLDEHGLKRISKRLAATGALDVVATATPGIKDILVLGKVKQLERAAAADVIVLDAPAAGHAITFLQSARGLLDAVQVGPINSQAKDVLALLTDPSRCRVMLVTLGEETPVNELIETAYALEDRIGVHLTPVVVNAELGDIDGLDVDPSKAAKAAGVKLRRGERQAFVEAADFRRRRRSLQIAQAERLADALPLPQIHLPFCFDAEIGPTQLDRLADAMIGGIGAIDAAAVGLADLDQVAVHGAGAS
ncbi:MAG: P-loop NTPase [Actinobacteria bacterium]|nr:P-loop NTPase [Actinomycetota bacterium]